MITAASKCNSFKQSQFISDNLYGAYVNAFQIALKRTGTGGYIAGSVKTPNGTTVQTLYDRYPELTSAEKEKSNTQYAGSYPNAVRLAQPTVKYNCHSYAWHSQSTSNKHWMNDPRAYWNDGSYAKLDILPRVGNKAHWPTGEHSAVVSKITYQNGTHYYYYTSKWGMVGLYEHFISDCPYTGSVNKYEKNKNTLFR